jgi:hypothetical protein
MFGCIWNILDIFCTAETQCVGSSKQAYMAVVEKLLHDDDYDCW